MKAKELLEARWKLIIFGVLSILIAGSQVVFYQTVARHGLPGTQASPAAAAVTKPLIANLGSLSAYIWTSWFALNDGVLVLTLLATILGSGLIAGEVSKGTIYYLLSKPVSRTRILLTKYGVNAAVLFAVTCGASLAIEILSIVVGQPQNPLRLLIATVLLWLGTLSILSLTLIFSVLFNDILRPMVFALLLAVALWVPAAIPGAQNWSIIHYWSNFDAYMNGGLPFKELLFCLIAATIPFLFALSLFKRKAY